MCFLAFVLFPLPELFGRICVERRNKINGESLQIKVKSNPSHTMYTIIQRTKTDNARNTEIRIETRRFSKENDEYQTNCAKENNERKNP